MDMDISLVIAIVAVLGTLGNSLILKFSNKKNDAANANKTNVESTSLIFQMQETALQNLQIRIIALEVELSILKKKDNVHNKEKIRLEGIILKITSENKKLKNEVHENKRLYQEEIIQLTKQINHLTEELQKYINT